MDMVHGTSLYFQGREGSWKGIFGYGLENGTLWKVAAAAPQTGLSVVMDDVVYFGEYHNSSIGYELHAVNVSNGTKWLVEDINSGSGVMYNNAPPPVVLGDVFLFNAISNSVYGTYAHNISNGSTWRIATEEMWRGQAVVGDVAYFMMDDSSNSGNKLNAYNASNNTLGSSQQGLLLYNFSHQQGGYHLLLCQRQRCQFKQHGGQCPLGP